MPTKSKDICGCALVRVTWVDAASHDDWMDLKDVPVSDTACTTVGFLVCESPSYLWVAGTIGHSGDCTCVMQIPRGMVTRTEVLKK